MTNGRRALLLELQNRDGGWPSHPGRSSNTEATSLAVLALRGLGHRDARHAAGCGLQWLAARQRPDGGWPFSDTVPEASWATALATLAMQATDRSRASRAAAWLLRQEPRRTSWLVSVLHRVAPSVLLVRQDPHLRGWAWRAGAASFAEPTAYAVIALKRLGRHRDAEAAARIGDAERMLYDRMCPGGGWNYGNSVVLGVDMEPYADVTALTLIALQDHQGSEPNVKSVAALRRLIGEVDSSLALAWSVLCLSIYGQDTAALRRRLEGRSPAGPRLVDTKTVALSVLALEGSEVFHL